MKSFSAKAFSAIATVLCFCLLFSSTAGAFVMATHSMGSHDMHDHGSLTDAADVASLQLHDHSSNHNHSSSHDRQTSDRSSSHACCDDGEGVCASSCATHCSSSVTNADQCLFPTDLSANFDTEFKLTNLTFVDLAGPFKPPRH